MRAAARVRDALDERAAVGELDRHSRLPAYPNVSTVVENGRPAGFAFDAWTALLTPKGTPASIILQINKAVAAALDEADIRQRLTTFGYEAWPFLPAETGKALEAEMGRYADIIRSANISFD